MDKQFFKFCHLLYRHDKSLATSEPETAYKLCLAAGYQFDIDYVHGIYESPEQWISQRYDEWLKGYVYVSDHMPEKCK